MIVFIMNIPPTERLKPDMLNKSFTFKLKMVKQIPILKLLKILIYQNFQLRESLDILVNDLKVGAAVYYL